MFTDTEFMTARDKGKVLKQWRTFLANGCQRQHFTKRLYKHLINHCSFIAHYDINGFYGHYFTSGDQRKRFLSQFDQRNGDPPRSIEIGMTCWAKGDDYGDINQAMIQTATPYIDQLTASADDQQRLQDLFKAAQLLHKHGYELTVEASADLLDLLPKKEPTQVELPGL